MGTQALIGLGSNLGDRRAILDAAIVSLAQVEGVEVRAPSSYHETAPVGGPPNQGAFLNGAVAVETSLSPVLLHAKLREIEHEAGRVRVVRWGERSLDLDLLLFGGEIIESPGLQIPHPRMPFRRFVLAPLAEIAAEDIDPLTGRSIAELLALVDRRPSYVALHRPGDEGHTLSGRLGSALSAVIVEAPVFDFANWGNGSRRAELLAKTMDQFTVRLVEAQVSAGNGWIVSDYWFDAFYFLGPSKLDYEARSFEAFRRRFIATRQTILMPTLVVGPRLPLIQRPSWADRLPSIDPQAKSSPILRPEAVDTDGLVEEILACCLATRSP